MSADDPTLLRRFAEDPPVSDTGLARLGDVLSPVQVTAVKRLQTEQLAQLRLAPPPSAGFLGGPR